MSGTRAVPGHPGVYRYEVKKGPASKRTRYAIVASVGIKQKWLRGFLTIHAAEEALDALKTDLRKGSTGSAPARLTLKEYLDKRWLPSQLRALRSSESRRTYAVHVRHITSRDLGSKRLLSLTPIDIEDFKDQLEAEGVGAAMRNAVFDRLRQSLRQAMKWGLIARNPAEFIAAPVEPKPSRPDLPVEAIEGLLAEAERSTDYGALFHLAIMSGLRWGEIAALRWADIDFADGSLGIPKAKTSAGERRVGLDAATIKRLQAQRYEQMRRFMELGGPPPQLVFTTLVGMQLKQANFHKRVWAPLRARVGLPTLTFHGLRHVHSSLLARAGVHPRVMQERLGHADAKITMEVYTHVAMDQQKQAAEAVAALLWRSGGLAHS